MRRMRRRLTWLLILLVELLALGASSALAQQDYTQTPNLSLKKPKLGSTNFGTYINADFDTIDAALGHFHGGLVIVPSSATPVFNLLLGNTFQLTMTQNATSSTTNQPGITAGQFTYYIVCQDGIGGRTFNFPSNFMSPLPTVTLTPNKCSASTWVWSATFNSWVNTGGTGSGGGGGGTPTAPNNSIQYDANGAFGAASLLYFPANSPCSYLPGATCDDYVLPAASVCLSATAAADAGVTFGNAFSLCDSAANAIAAGVSGATIGATATSRSPATRALPMSSLATSLGATSNATGFQTVVSDDPLDGSAGPANMWGVLSTISLTRAAGAIPDAEAIRVGSPFSQASGGAPAAENAVLLYGIHVLDQLGKGSTQTAALKIDSQTGAANFAIKVDGGKSQFDGGAFATFFSSETANPASASFMRLANADTLGWRNFANTGNLVISTSANGGGNIPADAITFTGPTSTVGTLVSAAFVSNQVTVATAGVLRLASTDLIDWRNNANSGNVALSKNASDNLVWPNSVSIGATLVSGSGSGTATLPANAGTVAELNLAETWTAAQTFSNGTELRFLSSNGTNYAGFKGGASTTNLVWLFPTTDSTGTQCLASNGSFQLSFTACSAGTGTPGGANTQVQFNNTGTFGGSTNLTWISPALIIGTAAGATGQVKFVGTTSGTVTAQSQDAAGTWTFKWPNGAGSAGQPMVTDGSGVASWATLGFAGGGTNQTTFTANQLVTNSAGSLASLTGTLTGTNPVLTLTSALTTSVPFALNTPAAPTADIFDLSINSVKTAWFDNAAILHTPATTYTGSGPLSMSGNLGTCPAPAASTDILCLGDLGSGVAMVSNNGTSAKPIVLFTNTAPTAHGILLANPTFPQVNTTGAGTAGQVFVSGGPAADGAFGTVGVAGGGTGATTLTVHGVLLGEGASAIAATAAGTSGQAFTSGGAGADGAYAAMNLAGGASIFTGVLPVGNGGTGASSLAGASITTVTGIITPNDCAKFSAGTVITDSGAPCGGGSTPARLDQITAGTGSNTINSTVFPQTWNWALTGSTVGFKFGENTAATGASNIVLQATTLNTSTALPFQADNNGNGWQLGSTGLWKLVGTGTLAIPGTAHGIVVSEGPSTANVTIPCTTGQIPIGVTGADPVCGDPVTSGNQAAATTQTITATGAKTGVAVSGIGTVLVTVSGTYAGVAFNFEATPDGTFSPAFPVNATQMDAASVVSASGTLPSNTTRSWLVDAAGFTQLRVNATAYTSGTANITITPFYHQFVPWSNVNIASALPAGSAVIGHVIADSGSTTAVTGNVTAIQGTGTNLHVVTDSTSVTAATLSAETTKVIGTVRTLGNLGVALDAVIGAASPANVFAEGLKDTAGNAQAALSDTSGRQFVKTFPNTTTTSYRASKKFALSSTTDIAVMPGNATNTVLVNRIIFSCTQTTAGIVNVEIIKRSTADSGGTSAGITALPDDANYAAAVSAPLSYTGTGPTVGTPIADADNYQLGCNAAATAGANDIYILNLPKPIVLRGTAQQLAINLGGAITGGNGTVTFEWIETTIP